MFGNHFYHQRIRKAVAVFGSLFNDLKIVRKNSNNDIISQAKVPLSYAPKRDFLSRLDAMSNGEDAERQIALKLPRMSFEILAMDYDVQRQLPKTNSCIKYPSTFDGTGSKVYTPVPYTITFQLNVYAKSQDDALQIVEQILPYFTPQYTVTVKPLSEFDVKEDTPITLTGITFSDDYEAPLEARRTIIYTLDFTMKLNLYKDIDTGSSIIYETTVNFLDFDTGDIFTSLIGDPSFQATPTSATTVEDTAITVSNFEVLNVPFEPASLIVTQPSHGTASASITGTTTSISGRIDLQGTWTYTPDADYNGSDSFIINVAGEEVTINVTVSSVADLINDTVAISYTVGSPSVDFFVSGNDSPEASPVTYSVAAGGDPSHGTIEVLNASTGQFRYTPTLPFEGTDSFTYRVSSETGTSEIAIVTLNVTYAGFEYAMTNSTFDTTNALWRDTSAPANYEFVPNSGIYTDTPIVSAESMFSALQSFNHSNPTEGATLGAWGATYSDDGTKFYVVGSENVYQFNLSTPWIVSTATYSGIFLDVTTIPFAEDAIFKADGTILLVLHDNGSVETYTLSTGYDLTTATLTHTFNSVGTFDTYGFGVALDGTYVSIIDNTNNLIYTHELSTPWDMSTASLLETVSTTLNGVTVSSEGLAFTADGLKMIDADGKYWNLNTKGRPSTAVYSGDRNFPPADGDAFSPYINSEGTWIAFGDNNTNNLYSYPITTPNDLSTISDGVVTIDPDIASWDTSTITNMRRMFYGQNTFNMDLNSWDVSNVTNMDDMFWKATIFNGNVTSWNVSSVTIMEGMFQETSFNQDISGWNVSSVTDMGYMFSYTPFNQNIGGWDVSSVTSMKAMFGGASSFNQDLNLWNTANVTDMSYMFDGDPNNILTNGVIADAMIFNGDVTTWNTSNVTLMNDMFENCRSFNQNIGAWNTSKVTDMSDLFNKCIVFNQDISAWDVSNVTNMTNMFFDAESFNQPLNSWNVAKVTRMGSMFESASVFNQDLNLWSTISVTTMDQMFKFATAFNGDISTWNTSNVTDMKEMFNFAYAFNSDISAWDVSSVTTFEETFYEARSFNADISAWNVSSATNMFRMFDDARVFNQDISGWDVSNVTNMGSMFEDAFFFYQNLSSWNVVNIPTKPDQFSDATGTSSPAGSWLDILQPRWGTTGV